MFGFLKDTLKKTVEKLTKEVDQATETVEPTEEQKKEIIEEIKEEKKKEEKKKEEKGFFARLKEKITGEEKEEIAEQKELVEEEKERKEKEYEEKRRKKEGVKKPAAKKEEKYVDETYGIEVIAEEKKHIVEEKKIEKIEEKQIKKEEAKAHPVDIHKREEEGEKEIDELLEKKKKEEEEKKNEAEKREEKGFFARLKEKFTHKEEPEQKKEVFEVNEAEVKEFEEAFKEIQTKPEEKEEAGEKEERIPVVTQTEEGETIFELQEKPTAVGKKKERKESKEKNKKEIIEEIKEEKKKEDSARREEAEKKEESKEKEETGFFGLLKDTIFKTSISEEKFEALFWELEVALLENNVAVEVIDLIKANLKKELVEKKILRGQINEIILKSLKDSVEQTFDVEPVNLLEKIKEKKPYVVVFVGINGSGKTTTIAKMIQKLKDNNLSCVVAAGDTFRAAAIQQLEEHTTRLNVKLIKHDYGADPAAVGFDAIKYAQAHNIDCVLIDTAGRLHSNVNLMDEMKKIIRVTKPDFKIFIGEAITGNDCVDQARKFNEAVGIDGIILAKADVDEKGGAALSVSYVTKKPILYLGTGQEYKNLEAFDKEKIMAQIGLG